jgi:hypothetical protein
VALEFVGRDFDRPLTKEDQDWLLSWNQVDLLAEHAEKWGPDHDGSEKVEEEPPPRNRLTTTIPGNSRN